MDVKNYIRITRYMSGDSLKSQIRYMVDNNMMNENTRLFFNKGNMLCTEDIAEMLTYFDIGTDVDFDMNNIVFIPKKRLLEGRIALQEVNYGNQYC